MSDAIVVDGLTKTFRGNSRLARALRPTATYDSVRALANVNLKVQQGEVVGLLGPNGAGKTTLLEILATVLLPSSGRASVLGHDVVREPLHARRVLGYSSSAALGFYPQLSGVQNLEFFGLLKELPRRRLRHRIGEVLDMLGMAREGGTLYQRYSEGLKQRLSLARSLLGNPSVLLLDEPTRSVDPFSREQLHRFLKNILVQQQGKTILVVTHSLSEMEELCDRAAIMRAGQIVAVSSISQLNPASSGEGSILAASVIAPPQLQ